MNVKKLVPILIIFNFYFINNLYSQVRTNQLIDRNWKFCLNDQAEAERVNYDDSKWETVQLPHDASIYGPFVRDTLGGNAENGYRPRHIGWYRKHLKIGKLDATKEYILEFEGIYRAAKVWVNGEYCGQFLNGYLDFEFNISNKIKQGDNLIAVRYDNTYKRSSRWYTGEGINRNVYLSTINKLHVARYGTYIITPVIDNDHAEIVVETEIVKDMPDSVNCRLVTDIISPNGQVVDSVMSVVPLVSVHHYKFHQQLKVNNPALWNLKSPNLYKAVSKLYKGKVLSDVYETVFGVRRIEFNRVQGFLLNGKKVFLKGVCLHVDLGPLGTASFDAAWNKRLSVLKNQLGCNAIRLSHNPYPKYVLDWCNRNGILVFDEAYDDWSDEYYGPGGDFYKHWKADLGTFVRRDRNNPCVFIWSLGNEVPQQVDGSDNFGVTQLKKMVRFVHQLDPSRKVTAALYPARWNSITHWDSKEYYDPPQMSFYMDVMSANYMERYFAGDRKRYPQLIPLISELKTGKRGERYFNYDHSYVSGQFYWGGTEYIGESFGWPSKGWINGIVDLCDNLKPIGYSIKSFYKEKEAMVFATVIDEYGKKEKVWNDVSIDMLPSGPYWNWKGKDSVTLDVYANCKEVELWLNGRLLTHKRMTTRDQNHFSLKVAYKPGELKVIGRNKGKVVAEQSLKTAGKAYKIVLKPGKKVMNADGLDLVYITTKVVDKNGVVVPTNSYNIKFNVSGSGTNAGVCSGDITSDEPFQADSRTVFNGECQLVVRSSTKKGIIKIEAQSEDLQSASTSITAK